MDSFDKQLRLILKNRLSNRANPKYLQWLNENKKTPTLTDNDHIAKRRNDLLIAVRDNKTHISDEYKDYTDNFIQALENIFDYIEDIQRNGT